MGWSLCRRLLEVYLTVSVQLVYTGLVCALMRGYRDPILHLLFGHGKVPQILFFISTIATIFGTNAIMWANVEVGLFLFCFVFRPCFVFRVSCEAAC